MKFLKKAISLLICSAILFSLAACGGDTDTSSDATSSTEKKPSGIQLGGEELFTGVWDGKVAENVARGGGTEEAPYLITSPRELAYAFSAGNKEGYYYQLACDIYLNDVSSVNWMNNEGNNVWLTNRSFIGHLDGNGFCIYGIYIDKAQNAKNAGLAATTENSSFKNLGIRSSFISAQNYCGAFAGIAQGSMGVSFENCFVDETVYVQYYNKGNNGAGGIIGYAATGGTKEATLTFKNCYGKAQVTGLVAERVNGIIGTSWDAAYTMEDCFSVGQKPFHARTERQASMLLANGKKTSEVYIDIYTNAKAASGKESWKLLSAANMRGEAAAKNMSGLDFESTFQTVSKGYPKLKVFESVEGTDISVPTIDGMSEAASDFAGGKGTKESPYVIKTAEQLRLVVSSSWANTYFKLANDIYVNKTGTESWTAKAEKWIQKTDLSFAGNFDGQGHTIYGLYYDDVAAEGDIVSGGLGLFPGVSGKAVIRNVHIKEAYLSGKAYVGAIAGQVQGNSKSTEYAQIIGCSVDDTVVLSGQTVGGILGGGGGGASITYSCFTGTIIEPTGGVARGNGMVGDIWSKNYKLAECYSLGYTTYRGHYTPDHLGPVYGEKAQNGVTVITPAGISGAAAESTMPDLSWGSAWKTTNGYPLPKIITEKMDYVFE